MGYNDLNPMSDRTDDEWYDSTFCTNVIVPAYTFVLRFPGLRENKIN